MESRIFLLLIIVIFGDTDYPYTAALFPSLHSGETPLSGSILLARTAGCDAQSLDAWHGHQNGGYRVFCSSSRRIQDNLGLLFHDLPDPFDGDVDPIRPVVQFIAQLIESLFQKISAVSDQTQ